MTEFPLGEGISPIRLTQVGRNMQSNFFISYFFRVYFELSIVDRESRILSVFIKIIKYMTVVGEREKSSGTVNVRTRDNKVHGEMSIEALIEHFNTLVKDKTISEDCKVLK